MADDTSLGELSRRQDRAEHKWDQEIARVRAEHQADVQRVEREHGEDLRALREDVIRPLQERMSAVERRPALTAGRWAGIALAVIALAALLVQAYGTLKGAK